MRDVALEYDRDVCAEDRDAEVEGQVVYAVENLPWDAGKEIKDKSLAVDKAPERDDYAKDAEPQRGAVLAAEPVKGRDGRYRWSGARQR